MEQRLGTVLMVDLVCDGRLPAAGTAASFSEMTPRLERIVAEDDGRTFGATDGRIVAEFASAVTAMRCALRLRQQVKMPADGAAKERAAPLRIGVSLGEILVEAGRISGEGIHLADRLTSLAEPGGICVSGSIFDQVEGKLAIQFDYIGVFAIENRIRPMRAYRARFDVASDAGPGAWAVRRLALPAKPSIAVLPFLDLSGDPERAYFSDGITEDIVTELSRFRSLFVIARNSSFAYRDRAVDARQVGRELGVQFLLEGSIRTAGRRARITAQLIDAVTGRHLWADRYDRDLEDIFAVQDELVRTIVSTLVGRLQHAGAEQAKRKRTESLAAYDYLLRGMTHLNRYTPEDNAEARRLLERAAALDPDYALAHAGIAATHLHEWFREGDDRALDTAYRIAEKALDLDDAESWCHMALGRVCLYLRRFARAEAHHERALALNPNDAHFAANMGHLQTYLGHPDDGVAWVEKAMRLNPHHPDWYCEHLGLALCSAHRYAEAVRAFRRITDAPAWVHAYLAGCFAHMGELDAARAEAAEALRLAPAFSIARSVRSEPFRLQADLNHWTEGLQKAGLPA